MKCSFYSIIFQLSLNIVIKILISNDLLFANINNFKTLQMILFYLGIAIEEN